MLSITDIFTNAYNYNHIESYYYRLILGLFIQIHVYINKIQYNNSIMSYNIVLFALFIENGKLMTALVKKGRQRIPKKSQKLKIRK